MNATRQADRSVLFGMLLIATVVAGGAHEASALEIGKPAPDFTLPSTTGEKISLSQFRGKLVLIEFYGGAFAPT
jgi:cytochrome oxidase Cu insertion factor (SCO1/SenC/PrrC family)